MNIKNVRDKLFLQSLHISQPNCLVGLLSFGLACTSKLNRSFFYSTSQDLRNNDNVTWYAECPRGVGDAAGSDVINMASSNTMTHLLLNATFPCRAYIRSWTYFRLRDTPRVFASVWRKEPAVDNYFRLVGVNVLAAGDVGWHQIIIMRKTDQIAVQSGDFIGFHYSGADVYRLSLIIIIIIIIITSPAGAVGEYCNEHVCVSVSLSLSVCLSVCPREYFRNDTSDLYRLFCACCRGSVLLRRGDEIPRGKSKM